MESECESRHYIASTVLLCHLHLSVRWELHRHCLPWPSQQSYEVGVLHLPGQEADRGYVTCPGLHSEPRCKPSSLTPKPRNQVLSVVNPWPLKPRGSKAAPNRSSTDCSPLSSCHPASAMHTSQERMPWADSPWDGPGGPAPVRQEPKMQMNSPTQQPHSLCQCETGFARGKKKCSFIRAGFYLNDAFQLNSLKLLLPPQNVSISKQGGLGSFHFADRKRKSIEKTCRLFKSHHQPQTEPDICGAASHSLTFYLGPEGDLGDFSL